MKNLFCAGWFLLLAAPAPIETQGPDKPGWQDIQQVLDAQVVAWNKADIPGFMAGYWQSPELTFYSGNNKAKGWKQTLERYQKKYQGQGKEMGKLAFTEIEIQLLADDHALVTGRWWLQMKKETVGGLFTLVMKKMTPGWRIIHDHTSN